MGSPVIELQGSACASATRRSCAGSTSTSAPQRRSASSRRQRIGKDHAAAGARHAAGPDVGSERVAEVLDQVGLAGARHRRAGAASHGMQRRPSCAGAIAGARPVAPRRGPWPASTRTPPTSSPLLPGATQALEGLRRRESILAWILLLVAVDLALAVVGLLGARSLEEAAR